MSRISKIPVWNILWSVVAGLIAGLLLFGGQCYFREMEKREQQQETKRYVNELERIVSRNPIRVSGDQAPDSIAVVQPTTEVIENDQKVIRTPIWVSNEWAPDGMIEAYLTTESIEDVREEMRFGSLRLVLDRLSVHLDARTGLMSENDRYAFNSIIFRTRNDVSTLEGLRARIAEDREGKFVVGMAEPLASIFFKRLRSSVDWLRD